MSTGALTAVVLAHVALPWAIRAAARRPGRLAAAVLRRPGLVYGLATTLLGVLAVAVLVTSGRPVTRLGEPTVFWLCLAALLGAGGPLLLIWLAGRRPRPFARRLPPGEMLVLVLGVAAEELLWRAVAFGLLVRFGVPAPVAGALAVLGFTLLHLPSTGWRRLPYLAVLATALTLLAAFAGLAAAIVCHAVHNIVVLTTASARSRTAPARVLPAAPPVPPARAWDG